MKNRLAIDQLPLDELKKETGFSLRLHVACFDKHLANNELSDSDCLEKITDFENFERSEGQTNYDFVANFDKNV